MPANFISANRMQDLTEIASDIIKKNINKTRNKQFGYTYDDFEISGTPNDFQVKVTTKEKVNLEWAGIQGNLKYNIVYKCTIEGLPPVMKQAWQNIEFDGQSLTRNQSTIQDYIYNSVNTISTFGQFDWGDLEFNESVAFNNFKVAVEGSPSVKLVHSRSICPPLQAYHPNKLVSMSTLAYRRRPDRTKIQGHI